MYGQTPSYFNPSPRLNLGDMGQAICLMGKPTGEWLANEFCFWIC
jgi:hypothetical protein